MEPDRIGFRRLRNADLPMIHRWLHTPHVARWWHEDTGTFEEVSEEYTAHIEGEEPVEPFLILYDDGPVGYIQSYRVSDDEEYEGLIGIENSAGIDLFIGEEYLLYRGFGPLVIRRFIEEVFFADGASRLSRPRAENTTALMRTKRLDTSSPRIRRGPVHLINFGGEFLG